MSHLKKEFALVVDERELATILAALRFHQDENLRNCPDISRPGKKGYRHRQRFVETAEFR